ncbi:MAG TPA: M14 family zinc carboxypeptidase [Pyrinomonadaceae bacterium]
MFARALAPALASALALSSTLSLQARTQRSSAGEAARARSTAQGGARVRAAAAVPAPESVLGFRPGDDRKLAAWAQVVEYFRRLDAASPRVRFEELGKTTLGAPFVVATISAPENLARLSEYKDIQRRLADPRLLGRRPDGRAASLVARGKAVVLITCGVHSTEVGSYLSSMLIAHRLASSDDAEVREILLNTIVLLVPSLNPDGVDIVKRWYDRTLGTPHEGTSPPELYHPYVGHDNNRDWYAFTQAETRLTVDKIHNVWRPQIVHDIHQMGSTGARIFLPPYMQPVEPNVPVPVVEAYTELGRAVAAGLRAKGMKGVVTDAIYDAWTPARAYSHYHGGARILSETASARIATPTTVKPEQLRAGSDDGYDPRKESANFPDPWPGGDWSLRDITGYMTSAAFELMKHAAQNREHWLRRFYEVGREAVRPRRRGELVGYKILGGPNTNALIEILDRGGLEVRNVPVKTPRRGRGRRSAMDELGPDLFVPLAQPYGGFAKALLEKQNYPNLRDPAGNPIQPYDVTAHTLPLLMGVEVEPVYEPIRTVALPTVRVGSAERDGVSFVMPPAEPARPQAQARVGLYKSHVASMDEGWTRWVLEQEGFKYRSLLDAEARAGSLRAKYDAIVLPDQSARAIFEGHRKGTMPDELTGGLGEEGVRALREFVERGGTLVCLNSASNFAIEHLKLPVRNALAGLRRTDFFVPGSILRIVLDKSHPITEDMPQESVAWFEDSPAFEIAGDPAALPRVKIVARYPQSGNPLLSGWLLGEQHLRGRAALVEVGMGEGRVILFGFRPQYRAQSLATYPLLFNAIAHGGSRP